MTADQNARDDAIVLAALPGRVLTIWFRPENLMEYTEIQASLRRLKRAGKVRYVREMKRWERV